MSGLDLRQLASDGAAILLRHGRRAGLDLLALGVGMITAEALLVPERFVAARTGAAEGWPLSILLDPFLLLHEAGFALLFGAACLRIADDMGGAAGRPTGGRLRRNAVPLIVTMIALGYLSYFALLLVILPALLLAAATTTAYPAILVEDRGWAGLRRSIAQCLPHLFRLTAAWAVVFLPFLFVLFAMIPEAPAETGAETPVEARAAVLWVSSLGMEVVQTLLNLASLGLIMAAYRQLGPDGDARQLNDVFE
ncbi:hypothetical protein GE300_00615 [Rhodobacteraceae bacterium 2CG4]|uniref:Glycerophosphoryl diester phosphodiesterase membrane domain-containing protein n=1 Tax=Halovulum marinum TaxID=2662447 RepID=A0A6L5YWT0_9RHOB|nr:hypothetical protein [Halovulum marinum]MSU88114.1 hypothetical protein [Halovulum marinum]